jgi:4-hydroxymandelate oxidase
MAITRRKLLLSAGALAGASALSLEAGLLSAEAQQTTADTTAGMLSLSDFEEGARKMMSPMAYEFVASGAADELTSRWNRESLGKIRLRPRVLVDVSKLNTRVTLFDQELPFPILLAPTAYHRLYHAEGELATARGAGAAAATYVVSSYTTTPVEEIARVATQPLWFQLYIQPDRGFTKDVIQRAEAAGCRALCVTVDLPVVGVRNRMQRAGFKLPPELKVPYLMASQPLAGVPVTWKDIDWLRSFTRIPVLLKGVLNPDDADLAVKNGVSGIVVSNHGARDLDTTPATIDALPQVAEKVGGRVPVLMDGGIRRGTDVLKALALGANAVLIGRPYCYGLGMAGAEGVSRVVNILRSEFEVAMALTGRPTIRSIDRSVLWSAPS